MAGRPSSFSEEIAQEICLKLSLGESLRSILSAEEKPAMSTVMRWLAEKPEFQEQYARARQAQAEYWAEQIVEIADDSSQDTITNERGNEVANSEWINRSRLRVDTRKWLMSKLLPKKYGDKIDHTHTGDMVVKIAQSDANL